MWLAKAAQKTEGKKRTARADKKEAVDVSAGVVSTAPEEDVCVPTRQKKRTAGDEDRKPSVRTPEEDVSVSPGPKKHRIVDEDSVPDRWIPEEDIYEPPRKKKPKTEAGREKQMVALAVDLAEKQLREGTASAQVITHYLKLGTEKEKLERDILRKQKDLIAEKTNALKSASHMEEMYAKAIEAMKVYGGGGE